jgi:hypothetical protein
MHRRRALEPAYDRIDTYHDNSHREQSQFAAHWRDRHGGFREFEAIPRFLPRDFGRAIYDTAERLQVNFWLGNCGF